MVIHNTTRGTGKSISRENKATRKAFGQEHAPAVVGKPEHGGLGKAYRAAGKPWNERLRDVMASIPMPAFLDEKPAAPDWFAGWEILNRTGYNKSVNEQMRPVRLQLARMCGPRPRYIPSGEVIALGPGNDPTPSGEPHEVEHHQCEGWLNSAWSPLHKEQATTRVDAHWLCDHCAGRALEAKNGYRALYGAA